MRAVHQKADLFVGQPVLVYLPWTRPAEWITGTITRIGRTNVGIDYGTYHADFRIDDGFEASNKPGSHSKFRTYAAYSSDRRREAALSTLSEHGLKPGLGQLPLSTDALVKMAAIAEEDA